MLQKALDAVIIVMTKKKYISIHERQQYDIQVFELITPRHKILCAMFLSLGESIN